jgi:hypothetical protein
VAQFATRIAERAGDQGVLLEERERKVLEDELRPGIGQPVPVRRPTAQVPARLPGLGGHRGPHPDQRQAVEHPRSSLSYHLPRNLAESARRPLSRAVSTCIILYSAPERTAFNRSTR